AEERRERHARPAVDDGDRVGPRTRRRRGRGPQRLAAPRAVGAVRGRARRRMRRTDGRQHPRMGEGSAGGQARRRIAKLRRAVLLTPAGLSVYDARMPLRARWVVVWLALAGVTVGRAALVRDNLYGVKALSATESWAVGNYGAIFHTTNAGE